MLSRILKAFERAEGPLDLNELSRRLGVERSALDGMLEYLVHKGKLREVVFDAGNCAYCAGRLSCAQLQMGNLVGRAYELVE